MNLLKRSFHNRFFVFLFCLFLFQMNLSCDSGSGAVFDPILAQKLAESLSRSVDELEIPGAVMAVRAPDGSVWTGASGFSALSQGGIPQYLAQVLNNENMSSNLYFRIASVTKTFTATIILELVDEGKLSLDDTVNDIITKWFLSGYFNFAIPYGDTITLRNLLEMRSGMVDSMSTKEFIDEIAKNPHAIFAPVELVRMSAQSLDPAPVPPDINFEYRNTNYILLGVIIEQVTHNSYEDEVQSRLLEPLGMTHTMLPADLTMPEPFAHGYKFENGLLVDMTEAIEPSWAWSAGALISTIDDLIVWTRTFVSRSLLSPTLQQERLKMKAGTLETWPVEYGLGIYNDDGAIGHYGIFMGYYTSYCVHYNGYDFAILENGELKENQDAGRHPARSIFWNAVSDTGIKQ